MSSEMKPKKIDKVKWALYRTVSEAKPERLAKAQWVLYGAVALSTVLMVAGGPTYPKYPRNYGD